ncbi:ATP-binding cassette domain-containing protein [Ferrimonas balearica]|uniref:ABC transporter ATP-binding protein n=1 Tax=Ferrimonas balearica TaxID=44012 RepID=UPI001C93E49E|nr:ATP-binding cassette domain-containing protein [Ferrimonas balearica]MBY5979356.1 ATP-binding cassette domain-containing protein [Ferrimonas balearica]
MIEIRGLSKRFAIHNPKEAAEQEGEPDPRQRGRFFHSVESVHLTCEPGQVVGLVGPNGAGKTTTLRLLSGVLKPDGGSILVEGEDLHRNGDSVRRKIGFISATTGLYERLSVQENLLYFARLYGLEKRDSMARVEELCEQLDLGLFRHRRLMDLSSGMKQRANIARAVIHRPSVIIFDEPTTGLDIMSTETVIDFIKMQRDAGLPVIFSTHHLEEVSLLCDRLSVIVQGHTRFDGPLEAFAGGRDTTAIRHRFMALSQSGQDAALEEGIDDCADMA